MLGGCYMYIYTAVTYIQCIIGPFVLSNTLMYSFSSDE